MKLTVQLSDEQATRQLGEDLAMALRPGDCLLLSGDLGVGKSTFARALLRCLADDTALEVPSPTYTLCQRYELAPPVSHFDFYRLGSPDEAQELGFAEALDGGVALVEWPERAPGLYPPEAMTVRLSGSGSERLAELSGGGQGDGSFGARVARSLAVRDFLDRSWETGVARRFLLGDASTRRYETASAGSETRILMDSPRRPDGPPIRDGKPYSQIVHLAEDVAPFVAIAETLTQAGLAAPAIHARSIREGFLLVEHLGEAKIVDAEGRPVPERYIEAARLLAHMHERRWPAEISIRDEDGSEHVHRVPAFDRIAIATEASLMADWYAPAMTGPLAPSARAEFDAIWEELAWLVEGSMPTLVLRDYHSPNLIWREHEAFPRNLGLIDFQDALIGPQAYDLASVGQDARVDVPPELEAQMLETYLAARRSADGFDEATFLRDYAVLAAQRATKILGIFVRLNVRDGKPGYLRHLPRMRGYLGRCLRHPVLARYREWCRSAAGLDAAS